MTEINIMPGLQITSKSVRMLQSTNDISHKDEFYDLESMLKVLGEKSLG